MKLAFTTLGCPSWTLDQVVRAAVEYGYQGVEVRGLGPHVDLRESPEFSASQRPNTRRRFEDAGLAICCLGASSSFANPDRVAGSINEASAYVELAAELGCPLVRVFGGTAPEGESQEEAAARVAGALSELAPFAREHRVTLVLETHDSFSTGAKVAGALRQVASDSVGALWDLHHPYRQGEAPEETYAELAPYLRHTHVKDSRDGAYCLLGEGDVPVREMIRLLRRAPAQGPRPEWLSLEWEKRWHPEIADPEVAFPQYARTLKTYLEAAA